MREWQDTVFCNVLKVLNPSGGVETTRRGDFGDTNYSVQAHIYCEYRPADSGDGFERYALFARDSGTGGLGLTNYGGGNSYALTYDSDTGRPGGHIRERHAHRFSPAPLYMTDGLAAAADRFRGPISVLCRRHADRVVTDSTFVRGYFGIRYHGYSPRTATCGTRADNLSACSWALPNRASTRFPRTPPPM
jgi:hypothetical protein